MLGQGGVAQLDLFAEPPAPRWWLGEGGAAQAQRLGWEHRVLAAMAGDGPITYCFPGFMGAACERAVAKGWAAKVPAGEMPMPDFWPDTRKGRREWAERGPCPQFRYSITDNGRAILAAQEAA